MNTPVTPPEEGRSFGRVESEESLDLSGIESAVEDAVTTLEASIDDTLDSVGSTARSLGVIVLFALAAIATTVVPASSFRRSRDASRKKMRCVPSSSYMRPGVSGPER